METYMRAAGKDADTPGSSVAPITDSKGTVRRTVAASSVEPTHGLPTQAHVRFWQQAAGNAAVGNLLTTAPRTGIQRQPMTAPPSAQPSAPPATPDGKREPEIRQGKLGELEFPLPDVNVVNAEQVKPKKWGPHQIVDAAIFKVPVPELPGATVGIAGVGEIGAELTAQYGPGKFQNLRVGMTKWQAAQLAAGASPLLAWNAARVLYQGPFTAIGNFTMPASVGLRLFANAGMGLRGDLVGVKVIQIAATLNLELNAELGKEKPFEDNNVGIRYANGDLSFRTRMDRTLQFNMGIALSAALTAEILKIWKWERRWRLAESMARSIDMSKWPILVRFNVKNESHGTLPMRTDGPALNALIVPSETTVTPEIEEGKLDINTMLNQLFTEADKQQGGREQYVTPKGGRSGHLAPTGTKDDPIPMTWYKPVWWYLDPVALNINGKKREFRRDRKAMLPHGEAIGVSYWPAVGDVIRITSPTKRTGNMQYDFNKALKRYGFNAAGWNADHVEDLEMGGSDDFDNLWPLESGVNQRAGNWQLGQPVKFSKDTEPVGKVYGPIAIQGQEYLRGRYFVIRAIKDPP